MASIDEALLGQATPLAAALASGVDDISKSQVVTFTKYVRLVLPIDGYVFWVKADLVSASALANVALANTVEPNQPPVVVTPAATISAKGSLHYATVMRQDEAFTNAANRVVFTSETEIQDFNQIGPSVLFIGTIGEIDFAFSGRGSFYQQAGLYHYVGDAVFSDMASQIVNSLDGFDATNQIVSNSLPLWLALNGWAPVWALFPNTSLTLYPSYLVPQDAVPPYGVVHIVPESTRPLQTAPVIGHRLGQWQLITETVRVTLYGTRNYSALSFLACVEEYSLDGTTFGIMNMPAPRDEKRTQTELQAIAMKKTIEFQISYHQQQARNVARQLILEAIPSFVLGAEPPILPQPA